MNRSSHQKRASRWILIVGLTLAPCVIAVALRHPLLAWFGGEHGALPTGLAAPAASSRDGDIDYYTCSMHPAVKQHARGKCPICGMDLVPVTKLQHEQGVVMVDEARRQLIGVRTGPVTLGPMQRSFRAVGHVTYDESTLTDVNLKVRGWITKLFVNETGQRVTKGQPLFFFYSPELYSAQQDFLLANSNLAASGGEPGSIRASGLGKAAAQRLHLLGLGDAQIDALQKGGAPAENIAISAPASGFVIEKDIVEGAAVEAGMRLYRIAALNRVWVEVEVYEADLARVRVGQSATVTLDYLPGRSYEAKVAYVYPSVDPTSRTGRLRVELANRELDLRPGMYASVELAADAESRLQVPASAVVYTGPRRLVFVDLGEGRFRPQEIQVGSEAGGAYEVLTGLKAGDIVATSGVFLIAAEARISTAAKYWDAPSAEPDSSSDSPDAGMTQPTQHAPTTKTDPTSRVERGSATADSAQKSPSAAAATSALRPTVVFTCPMHPDVRSAVPGQSPKCGMSLEPAANGAAR